MGWTVPELEAALAVTARSRTVAEQETVDVAARMLLEFRLAQQASPMNPIPATSTGSAEALANAALAVVKTCLVDDEFVPRGQVTFAVMDLQLELHAYRAFNPPPAL
jgi:hypothetical protein